MLVSEREDAGPDALGPTLVVCPMSVARQWVAEIARFAPSLRVHLHHGLDRLTGAALADAARGSDVVVTSYDIATRDVEALASDRLGPAAARRGAGRQEPGHEARAGAAPAARAAPARDDRHADREPARRALGDHGSRQSRACSARASGSSARSRGRSRPYGDERALERLRSIVQPFILRRPKDSAEVELELPPITIEKDYCRLTVEQASLYRATVDRWLPRIEEHEDRFGRRGAVLAMLGPAEAGLQPPRDRAPDRAAARRPLGQARAARRAARGDAARGQGARLHAVPRLRPARHPPRGAARP